MLVATAACGGGEKASNVLVKNVNADLVFGVTQPDKDTTSPNVNTGEGELSAAVGSNDLSLPPQVFAPVPPKLRAPANPSRPRCPDAAVNAFPAESAGLTVPINKRPEVGGYRWKKRGSLTTSSVPLPIGISGFEQRALRNVVERGPSINTAGTPNSTRDPGVIFDYETVQRDLFTSNVVVTTYRVNTSPTYQTVFSPASKDQVRTGEPDRGVSIRKIEVLSDTGARISKFEPSTGLLLAPLPIQPGERFQSVAIDPATGQNVSYNGLVGERQRVDACGEIVDGWEVTGTQTFSGQRTLTRTYNIVVATQLGGIVVSEVIDQTDASGSLKLTNMLGQVKPGPLDQAGV